MNTKVTQTAPSPRYVLEPLCGTGSSMQSQIIDIRSVRMESVTNENSDHVAVLLPEYGLMFTAATLKKAKNWSEAKKIAGKCEALGFTDWRLPEVEELALLIKRDRSKPSIDGALFPDTRPEDWYWTNTVHVAYPAVYAWYVFFNGGYVGSNDQNGTGFVRAVRSVPASQ